MVYCDFRRKFLLKLDFLQELPVLTLMFFRDVLAQRVIPAYQRLC